MGTNKFNVDRHFLLETKRHTLPGNFTIASYCQRPMAKKKLLALPYGIRNKFDNENVQFV